jgi:hypothetical protein
VCATALAYGVAHGVRDVRKAAASIVSAFVVRVPFTIGFSLTHDLWWLMPIHGGLPLLALTTPRSATRP